MENTQKFILSKFFDTERDCVYSETTASLDVRVLDFDLTPVMRDRGSKCILHRQDDYERTIVYEKEGDSSCQTFICAGTSVKTYFGQVVTVKSVQDSALQIVEVYVRGVEIDCPYSAFSDEDGNYDVPMLELVANFQKICTLVSCLDHPCLRSNRRQTITRSEFNE